MVTRAESFPFWDFRIEPEASEAEVTPFESVLFWGFAWSLRLRLIVRIGITVIISIISGGSKHFISHFIRV